MFFSVFDHGRNDDDVACFGCHTCCLACWINYGPNLVALKKSDLSHVERHRCTKRGEMIHLGVGCVEDLL